MRRCGFVLSWMIGCAHAPAAPAVVEAPPSTTTIIRACGVPSDATFEVKTGTVATAVATTRDAEGCVRAEAQLKSISYIDMRIGEAREYLWIPPRPGRLELTAHPGATPMLAIESHGELSDATDVQRTYMTQLRAKHDETVRIEIAARLRDADSSVERDAWRMVDYLERRWPLDNPADHTAATTFVQSLPPEHAVWSLEWEAIAIALRCGDVTREFAERVAAGHPDPDVRGAAASALVDVGQRVGDLALLRKTVARLRADAPAAASIFGQMTVTFDPDRGLRVGERVPPLTLVDPEADERPVELASLRDRVVVVHFWSTWCGGCREGVAALELLRAAHPGDELAIVSIAFDEEWPAVVAFRAGEHPMKWQHARLKGETPEQLSARFEITSSTKTLVLGKGGKIVAENLHPGDAAFAELVERTLAPVDGDSPNNSRSPSPGRTSSVR